MGGSTTGGFGAGGSTTGSGGSIGGFGGSTSTGGAETGGTSGTGGIGDCSDVPPSGTIGICVADCGMDPNNFISPVCAGNHFECPDGSVEARSCLPESCARRDEWECCNHATGTVEPMRCSADGWATLPCFQGTEQQERGAACIPDGIDATSCTELQNIPCSDFSLQCHEGSGCGDTTCTCQVVLDVGPRWSCATVLCIRSQ